MSLTVSFIPLKRGLLFLLPLVLISCSSFTQKKFNKHSWEENPDMEYYPNRNSMYKDLLENHKLIGLSYTQLVDSIGEPQGNMTTKDSTSITIVYPIDLTYDVIDPDYSKDLIITLSPDRIVEDIKVTEWKKRKYDRVLMHIKDSMSHPSLPHIVKKTNTSTAVKDSIQWDSINDTEVKVDGYVILSETDKNLERIHKKVDSISYYEGEGDCRFKIWNIKKSSVWFCKGSFIDLYLDDNSMSFKVKGRTVKIGDDDKVLKELFPLSFKHIFNLADRGYGAENKDKFGMAVTFTVGIEQDLEFEISSEHKILSIHIFRDEDN